MLTREIKCPQCGAPKISLPDAVVLCCDFCGSFVSTETGQLMRGDGMLEAYRDGIRRMVSPSAADARKMVLTVGMQRAAEEGDRQAWRLQAEEYYALLPLTNPELVPPEARSRKVGRWVRETVPVGELSTFDPEVKVAQAALGVDAAKLYQEGDKVAVARELVRSAENYYETIYAHPDYPAGAERPDVGHMARNLVRASVEAASALLGPDVAATIMRDVLQIREADGLGEGDGEVQCQNCGGHLTAEQSGYSRCPYCDGVLNTTSDPWLDNLLASWQVVAQKLEGEDRLALGALQYPLNSYHVNGVLPVVERHLDFLRAAVGWLQRAQLVEPLRTLGRSSTGDPVLLAYQDRLILALADWEPGPRPKPSSAAPDARTSKSAATPSSGDLGQDPWVVQQVAMWRSARPHLSADAVAVTLLSYAMQPFYLDGEITVAQALTFFEQAEPEVSRPDLVTAMEPFTMASMGPALDTFLSALARALR